MSDDPYPEHTKFKEARESYRNGHDAICDFCEFLQGTGRWPVGDGEVTKAIAAFYQVDYDTLEAEKRSMLAQIREGTQMYEADPRG